MDVLHSCYVTRDLRDGLLWQRSLPTELAHETEILCDDYDDDNNDDWPVSATVEFPYLPILGS
jgi:gamma-glutamylcysteine synthetase